MVIPWYVCYVVQFHWLERDPLGCSTYMAWCHWFNWKWRIRFAIARVSTLYSSQSMSLRCFVGVSSQVSKINMNVSKFECLSYHNFRSFYMTGGGKSFDTCFRSSKRKAGSTPPLRAYFKQQSSPRSSYGALRKTNLFQAFLPQEVSHRFMFTNKTHCLLWAVLLWDTFQPKQFDTQSLLWRRLNWQYQWDPLPLVSCKALGYISA